MAANNDLHRRFAGINVDEVTCLRLKTGDQRQRITLLYFHSQLLPGNLYMGDAVEEDVYADCCFNGAVFQRDLQQ